MITVNKALKMLSASDDELRKIIKGMSEADVRECLFIIISQYNAQRKNNAKDSGITVD